MTVRAFALFMVAAVVLSRTPVGADADVQTPIFRSQGGANVAEVADPENSTNDVVRFVTNATAPASPASPGTFGSRTSRSRT